MGREVASSFSVKICDRDGVLLARVMSNLHTYKRFVLNMQDPRKTNLISRKTCLTELSTGVSLVLTPGLKSFHTSHSTHTGQRGLASLYPSSEQ